MKKIWISVLLLTVIISGGFWYNSYLGKKTDRMLELAEVAHEMCLTDLKKCEETLDEIDEQLESIGVFLCAFMDRDVINEAKDAIVSAKGLAWVSADECRWGIDMMKEKIGHIKNTTQIKLKYIL